MSRTYTVARASTFSEARARDVMQNVLGDFVLVANAKLVDHGTIQKWHQDIEYAVVHRVVDTFQIQFTEPDGTRRRGLSYTVHDDGTILETSKAGGLDFYGFHPETKTSVLITYLEGAPNTESVRAYLQGRGWKAGGSLIDGAETRDRAFSKNGYGIERKKVGDW
jgi:hypothetical protein